MPRTRPLAAVSWILNRRRGREFRRTSGRGLAKSRAAKLAAGRIDLGAFPFSNLDAHAAAMDLSLEVTLSGPLDGSMVEPARDRQDALPKPARDRAAPARAATRADRLALRLARGTALARRQQLL